MYCVSALRSDRWSYKTSSLAFRLLAQGSGSGEKSGPMTFEKRIWNCFSIRKPKASKMFSLLAFPIRITDWGEEGTQKLVLLPDVHVVGNQPPHWLKKGLVRKIEAISFESPLRARFAWQKGLKCNADFEKHLPREVEQVATASNHNYFARWVGRSVDHRSALTIRNMCAGLGYILLLHDQRERERELKHMKVIKLLLEVERVAAAILIGQRLEVGQEGWNRVTFLFRTNLIIFIIVAADKKCICTISW